MAEPKNKTLYNKVKKEIYAKIPKHSAYRSGLLVKEYKKRGGTYVGKKEENKGLTRWFKEDWRTQDGSKTYKKKGDVFRPTKKITDKTPTTYKELTKKEVKDAQKEKKATGRVKKYKKKK